jgi:hypothetical protein
LRIDHSLRHRARASLRDAPVGGGEQYDARVRLASDLFSLELPEGFVDTSRDGVASAACFAEEVVVDARVVKKGAPQEEVLDELATARMLAVREGLGIREFDEAPLDLGEDWMTRAYLGTDRGALAFFALITLKGQAQRRVVVTLSFYHHAPTGPREFVERAMSLVNELSFDP